ncbi:phosphotriesterase family protein [Streptomyces inhibens]|uniref:phosphotriesterase family protein n=1 Tax=Streptomyces inhibens TaxID=2293571 RepID=UPI001EE6F19B|nr:aryldialkylphosphatase [Streptomyces inhibens]UKY54180.1 aryldialkylphosphatase [Streptomyces inhibens]
MVRTVLGDIAPAGLGRTDYHEHLFQDTPLLPGDELDDEQRSGAEAGLLRNSGIAAMVDATPTGLGRDPAALARISADRGLHIVATTGAHREAHYGSGHWLLDLTEQQLTERFTSDVEAGMPEADTPDHSTVALATNAEPVRAGVLKAGIGYWGISRFEQRVLAAVAQAHARTGAPVMVHLEHGSATFELLHLLATYGVRPDAVVLAHIDRNPDPVLHAELADAGAYLGYDGFARTRTWPDSALLDCFVRAAELGAAGRLLLGGDVARRTRYAAYGGMPGLAYLGERIVPRLVRSGNDKLAEIALVTNPARLLGRIDTADTPVG